MTDLEIARVVRRARREGFAQACGAAFFGLLLTAPVVALSDDPYIVAVGIALGVLAVMGVTSVIGNRDPSE